MILQNDKSAWLTRVQMNYSARGCPHLVKTTPKLRNSSESALRNRTHASKQSTRIQQVGAFVISGALIVVVWAVVRDIIQYGTCFDSDVDFF